MACVFANLAVHMLRVDLNAFICLQGKGDSGEPGLPGPKGDKGDAVSGT